MSGQNGVTLPAPALADPAGYTIATISRIEAALRVQVLNNLDQIAGRIEAFLNTVKANDPGSPQVETAARDLALLVEEMAKKPIRRQLGLLKILLSLLSEQRKDD